MLAWPRLKRAMRLRKSSKGKKRKPTSILRIAGKWLIVPFVVIVLVTNFQVLALRFFNPPSTSFMIWESIRGKGGRSPKRLQYWRPLEEISPYLRKAVLAGEDQRFLSHHGFDMIELKGAIEDLARKKGKRGASTITMQVARTVYLWPGRSWLRKTIEAYYTVLIELYWSKERILEVYLNTVDWGTGTIGAEAAARRYFNTTSSKLTKGQAAAMAAILPSPHKWSPVRPNVYVKRRRMRILRDMDRMPLL